MKIIKKPTAKQFDAWEKDAKELGKQFTELANESGLPTVFIAAAALDMALRAAQTEQEVRVLIQGFPKQAEDRIARMKGQHQAGLQ